MSSRNTYLSLNERQFAGIIYQSLCLAKTLMGSGMVDAKQIRQEMVKLLEKDNVLKIDYVEIVDKENLKPVCQTIKDKTLIAIAVYLGKTRLIDNIIL
jgi:pantoate--beta-alanine ligase